MQVAMTTASSSIPPRASPSRSRRLETLVLFVEMGWCATASTFIAMNLGAGQKRRAHRAGGLAALYNVVLIAGMAPLFLVYSSQIVGFFDKSPGVIIQSGVHALDRAELHRPRWRARALASDDRRRRDADQPGDRGRRVVLLILPASIIVTESLSLPPIGLWLIIAAGNLMAAARFTIYYLRGSFLDKQV